MKLPTWRAAEEDDEKRQDAQDPGTV
jgi:hypothetical protein